MSKYLFVYHKYKMSNNLFLTFCKHTGRFNAQRPYSRFLYYFCLINCLEDKKNDTKNLKRNPRLYRHCNLFGISSYYCLNFIKSIMVALNFSIASCAKLQNVYFS